MSTAGQDIGRPDSEEMLARYDSFIVSQVRERVCQDPNIARPAVLDLEIDELIQLVRIKFWHALEEKEIIYPKAYIKRIVNSEFIDMVRRQRPIQPLPEDQEGEIYRGKVLVTSGEGMKDPAEVVEQREEVTSRMQQVAGAVLELPARQQQAMICSLQERVDDLPPLIDLFKERQLDIRLWQWPQEKGEKIRLQASLSYARHNLIRHMEDGEIIHHMYLSPNRSNVHTIHAQ